MFTPAEPAPPGYRHLLPTAQSIDVCLANSIDCTIGLLILVIEERPGMAEQKSSKVWLDMRMELPREASRMVYDTPRIQSIDEMSPRECSLLTSVDIQNMKIHGVPREVSNGLGCLKLLVRLVVLRGSSSEP